MRAEEVREIVKMTIDELLKSNLLNLNEAYPKVKEIVKKIHPEYNIHDFRIVKGNTHTNVVFDCVIPSDDHISHEKLASTIEQEINKLDGGPYYAVVEVEHSYV